MRTSPIAAALVLGSFLATGTAHANLIHKKVEGVIVFGQNKHRLDDASPEWTTISRGLEFMAVDRKDRVSANFRRHRLVIRDTQDLKKTSKGWQMSFSLGSPNEFKLITLKKSTFGRDFSYTIANNVLTIDWRGDTRRERRVAGAEKFKAVFRVRGGHEEGDPGNPGSPGDPGPPGNPAVPGKPTSVPEPASVAMFASALIVMGFAARRRKKPALPA
jgi:hypothetical protein